MEILYPRRSSSKIRTASPSYPMNVLQPWLIITTATIFIRGDGVVQYLLYSELSVITARQFEKIQSEAMHKPSRPMLKAKKIDLHYTIKEQSQASVPTIIIHLRSYLYQQWRRSSSRFSPLDDKQHLLSDFYLNTISLNFYETREDLSNVLTLRRILFHIKSQCLLLIILNRSCPDLF